MGGDVIEEEEKIPSFEEAVLQENEHDGQAYVQYVNDTCCEGSSSEIIVDLRDKNHVSCV
jgi:hypothetical protein